MIDSKIVKENPNLIKEMLFKRNIEFPLDEYFTLDKNRRQLIIELQNLYHKKNLIAKDIAGKRKSNIQTDNQIQEMSQISGKIKTLENENKINDEKYKKLLYNIPNFFHDSIPIGIDEKDNKIIKIFNKNRLSNNIDIEYQDKTNQTRKHLQ